MHSKVITITLLFTFNTSLSKTDTVRTDSSFYYMTDDCLTDTVFQKLKELVKLAANICFWMNWSCLCFSSQGFWYLVEKKKQNFVGFSGANSRKNRPISRDFRGGKKSKFAKKNRLISRDFRGRKGKIRRKIVRFCRNLAEKIKFRRIFRGKFAEKSADLKGKFRG